ncbi:MAG: amidohydrolase [Blautia sp.]|nr:amidohydrolase [Blautia sp.]MDY5032184.1 amidohydrolase [Blautia sp.]
MVQKYEAELINLRRHFHRNPELGLEEFETSRFIRNYLEPLGYEIKGVDPTGLIAELPELRSRTRTVVLRAEMDGLPIQEKTGLAYASLRDGCMHACGHDAILASALILAKIISEEKEHFPVCVRFLFEPAEEIGEGTLRMLRAGALEDPVPDGFLMFHYAADQTYGMAVHEGQASAMISGMQITVDGKSSHWCQAEQGIDSIYGASLVCQAVHDLNETYVRKGPCIVGIGTVHGGNYPNIIADHVELTGGIRAAYEEDFYGMKNALEKELHRIEKQTGTHIRMVFPKDPILAFANDPEYTKIAAEVGRRIFKDRFLLEGEEELFLSGDNAYRYFQHTRGLFCVFLAAVPEKRYPLHHPCFVIDEKVLPDSVEALYEIIRSI